MLPFIHILGGVVLLLLGLRYLRKGFGRVMGGELVDWLQTYTHTRGRAFTGGVIAGAVMPSSTAMAFLSVRLSEDGKGPWPNILALLLGAQVGITVLVQLLTLPIGSWAMVFVALGGLLFLFFERAGPRGTGQILLAFGFMLMGITVISEAARVIAADPEMGDLFTALGAFPMLFALGAMILAVVLQSSTATIALGLGLSLSGEITPAMLFLWVLGTNLGLCLTVLMAGWSRYEGRLLGMVVLALKLPLAILLGTLFLVMAELSWLEALPGSLASQAAWVHTLFNLLAGVGVFFADHLNRWIRIMIGDEPVKAERGSVLEPTLLQYPSLALNAATREVLGLLERFPVLLEPALEGLRKGVMSPLYAEQMLTQATDLLERRESTEEFLNQISDEELDENDRLLRDALDDLLRELPLMIRSVTRDIPEEVASLLGQSPEPDSRAEEVVREVFGRFVSLLQKVSTMLMRENPAMGKVILEEKRKHSQWVIHAKRSRLELRQPVREVLDDFHQLIRRLTGVAYVYQAKKEDREEEIDYEGKA
ncbi:MAG: Na/Pi symporter [Opitutales bacterium]|nr:Na/Pi symporter [Opitutales bacterium]